MDRFHDRRQRPLLAGQVHQHLVHKLDRRRAKFQAQSQRVEGRGQRIELRHQQAARARLRHQVQLRFGQHRKSAFAADDQVFQPRSPGGIGIDWSSDQGIEVVAAHPTQNLGEAPANFLPVLRDHPAHLAINAPLQRRQLRAPIPLQRADRAEVRLAPVGKDHVQSADVIDGLAVNYGTGAGRVVTDHAAKVGPARGGYIGAELQAVLRQLAIELVQYHARLHAGRALRRVDVENVV